MNNFVENTHLSISSINIKKSKIMENHRQRNNAMSRFWRLRGPNWNKTSFRLTTPSQELCAQSSIRFIRIRIQSPIPPVQHWPCESHHGNYPTFWSDHCPACWRILKACLKHSRNSFTAPTGQSLKMSMGSQSCVLLQNSLC